jgi:hypothetical protein
METPNPADEGYPEEQPSEVDPEGGDTPQENRERQGEGRDGDATESGDGKATGNPHSAG